jgi:hypothetical protein
MQRVDELTEPPIVGQYYMVPTARELWLNKMSDWPILLPFHEDTEIIKFKWDHAHLDRRFMTPRQYAYAAGDRAFFSTKRIIDGMPMSRYASDHDLTRGRDPVRPRPRVVWRRRKCYRKMTPHVVRETNEPNWLTELEAAYANCHLKPGMICPHRGAHLGSMPVDAEGNVVCPMHGLKWNVATGEMVALAQVPQP